MWEHFCNNLSPNYTGFRPLPIDPTLRRYALDRALSDIDHFLHDRVTSNSIFRLPTVASLSMEILSELEYFAPHATALQAEVDAALNLMSPDQCSMYDTLDNEIHSPPSSTPTSHLHFITGKAGRGKSFVTKAIISHTRALGKIVAIAGTTALCVSDIDGACTAHSLFGLLVVKDGSDFTSSILPGTPRADYLHHSAVIIWDKFPMAQSGAISAVDILLRHIMNTDTPFGGKVIISIGDFRQVGPVIPNGGPTACFMASVLSLPIWKLFHIHQLTSPIRNAGDPAFAEFVDTIGEDTTHALTYDPGLHTAPTLMPSPPTFSLMTCLQILNNV